MPQAHNGEIAIEYETIGEERTRDRVVAAFDRSVCPDGFVSQLAAIADHAIG